MANVFRKLFGPPEDPPYDYGSVAYHKHWAAWWHKQARWQLIAPCFAVLFVIFGSLDEWFFRALVVFYLFLAGLGGARWQFARTKADYHRQRAWQVETDETIQGMIRSGMYEHPLEVVRAMRDGPEPPGWKREEWLAASDAAYEDLRKRMTEDGWPEP